MPGATVNETRQDRTAAAAAARFADLFREPHFGAPGSGAALQLGHLGRGASCAPYGASIYASGFAEASRAPYRVVSFYTAYNDYADHAARLRDTLERHAIPHRLVPVETEASWEATCAFKARFVRDMWQESDTPVVWLDADAVVESQPHLFAAIDADFAAHKWEGWKLAGGTLFFGKSALAGELLDRWVARCEADPQTWDQVHLHSAWCDVAAAAPLRTVWLPRAYCQIFDKAADAAPVIRHFQASRAQRRTGRKSHSETRISPQGQADRRDDRLWRPALTPAKAAAPAAALCADGRFAQALTTAAGRKLPVLEIGCGAGQRAALFAAQDYIGMEDDPVALAAARACCPRHGFRIADVGYALAPAPCALIAASRLGREDRLVAEALATVAAGRRRVLVHGPAGQGARWTAIARRAGLRLTGVHPAGTEEVTVFAPARFAARRLLDAVSQRAPECGFYTAAMLSAAACEPGGTDATA